MKMKLLSVVVGAVLAVCGLGGLEGASAHTDDHPCDVWRPELEFREFSPDDIDWFLDVVCPRESGHLGGTLEALNDSGEYSMGPVQMNYASGFHRSLGISKEWIVANPTNYWDAVVMLWNACGKGSWTKMWNRARQQWEYPCRRPRLERQAVLATDKFMIAIAMATAAAS